MEGELSQGEAGSGNSSSEELLESLDYFKQKCTDSIGGSNGSYS